MAQKLNSAFQSQLIALAAEVIVGNSFGSGIYVESKEEIFFCTARHVLLNNKTTKDKAQFQLKQSIINIKSFPKQTAFKSYEKIEVNLMSLFKAKLISFNPSTDVCAFKIGSIQNKKVKLVDGVKKLSPNLHLNIASSAMVKEIKTIEPGEELYVIGYPKALAHLNKNRPFYDYNLPLVRKGITSCMNDFKTFVIDCAVFGGNSGGPIFVGENLIINKGNGFKIESKRYLIGIATQYIPLLNNTAVAMNPRLKTFNHADNSGYGIGVSFGELLNEISNIQNQKKDLVH